MSPSEENPEPEPSRTPLDRALRLFGDVRRGEGVTVVLMTLNVFVVLVAYYVIKTVREPLILMTGGAELKAYAAACQALVLIVAVPVYSYFASRTKTRQLIFGATLFSLLCIEAFFVGYQAEIPMLGFAFFVWVGIFNVAIIAQFWSFANDIYSVPTGERLLPLIAVGATVGAPVGAWTAGKLFEAGLSPAVLMQVSAGLLLLHILLYGMTLSRPDGVPHEREADAPRERSISGGFALVFRNRYLTLIAALLVLLNLVNSTGEYLLSSFAEEQADAALSQALAVDPNLNVGEFMGRFFGVFYGDFFFWVNILGVILQALIASRIVKYLGVAGVLFALPIVAFGNYGWIAMGLGFGAFRVFKTTENATDYSIMNTAKAILWLPTSHDEKFQAKQAVDTFFVRLGDVIAAAVVYLGTRQLAFGPTEFAQVNVVIIFVWMVVAVLVLRRYRQQASS
ncbi:MAG: translocase [Myxococcales bacterium]|nr:translocase [Myxococcales bacterium]MDH3485911.1 translocase [Myxococcales bacterium]